MRFLRLSAICLLFTSPAHACMIGYQDPLPMSLQELHDAEDMDVAAKSKIDAAVWGVFLKAHPNKSNRTTPLPFSVGGTFKGKTAYTINVITNRIQITPDSHIYNLNLRQVTDDLWTDIKIPQRKLNWDKEACDLDPKSTRCSIYHLRQNEIKDNCIAHIQQMAGCWYSNKIPKVCEPYIKAASTLP